MYARPWCVVRTAMWCDYWSRGQWWRLLVVVRWWSLLTVRFWDIYTWCSVRFWDIYSVRKFFRLLHYFFFFSIAIVRPILVLAHTAQSQCSTYVRAQVRAGRTNKELFSLLFGGAQSRRRRIMHNA
jgi:hypothetical protein